MNIFYFIYIVASSNSNLRNSDENDDECSILETSWIYMTGDEYEKMMKQQSNITLSIANQTGTETIQEKRPIEAEKGNMKKKLKTK